MGGRGTLDRFECMNKFKAIKKKKKLKEVSLFLSHLGSRFPPPSPAPGILFCHTYCPGQDAESDSASRPRKRAAAWHPPVSLVRCRLMNPNARSQSASAPCVLQRARRERKRATSTTLTTRKRGPSRGA